MSTFKMEVNTTGDELNSEPKSINKLRKASRHIGALSKLKKDQDNNTDIGKVFEQHSNINLGSQDRILNMNGGILENYEETPIQKLLQKNNHQKKFRTKSSKQRNINAKNTAPNYVFKPYGLASLENILNHKI